MSKTLTNHIRLDDNDVAWLDDSNVKVIEVALDRIAAQIPRNMERALRLVRVVHSI